MIVKSNDSTYKVWWSHPKEKGKSPTHSICVISVGETKEDEKEVSRGRTDCSKKDNFCRRTGRKISLARALQSLFPSIPLTPENIEVMTMAEIGAAKDNNRKMASLREPFWEAYHKFTNDKR